MTEIKINNLVEWYSQPSGITTGIVANAPATRRVGVVRRIGTDGWVSVYDHDGIRAMVRPESLTVLAEEAYAGWAVKLGLIRRAP